jgi:hypothetical protein
MAKHTENRGFRGGHGGKADDLDGTSALALLAERREY